MGPNDTSASTRGPGVETRRLREALESKLFGHATSSTMLGRFEIVSRLGEGAMGVVYRARDTQLNREVAVKVLRGTRGSNHETDGTARLKREARSLAQLSHPNVVEVLDVGAHDSQVFIAMEFVRGKTLSQWCESTPSGVPGRLDRIIEFATDAARGLSAAHAAGVVHRDVKPENMLVGNDGRLRVADFGLARGALDPGTSMETEARDVRGTGHITLSATGLVVGTPAYMSPEQFGGHFDERSDQFSFCVAIWEAAFGLRPFSGHTISQVVTAIIEQDFRPHDHRGSDVRWLESILRKGLAGEPEQRHASMAALLEALTGSRPSPRRPMLFWGTLAVAVAGSSVALAAVSTERTPSPCSTADEPARAVWTPRRQQRLSGAAGLSAPIDHYVQTWIDVRRTSCESARAGDATGPELLDASMRCLDRDLERLDLFLSAVIEQPSSGLSDELAHTVRSWPSPRRCANGDTVLTEFVMPSDPAAAERVRALERDLLEDTARETVDPASVSRTRAEELVERARRLAHEPLLVLALQHLGERQVAGREVEASATFLEAYEIAARLGLFQPAARSATSAASALTRLENRHDDAERYLREAESMLDRVPNAPNGDRVQLSYIRAESLLARGLAAEAAEVLGEQLRTVTTALDEARLSEALGTALTRLGRYERAIETSRRALSIYRSQLGAQHPQVATVLNMIGAAELERGNPDRARDAFIEVRDIASKLVGPDHPIYAGIEANLGTAYLKLGDREHAEAAHRNALTVFDAALPEGHHQRSTARVNVAVFLESDAAEAMLNEALALAEQHQGADGPEATSARSALGRLYLHQRRFVRAETSLRRALEHHEKLERKRRAVFDRADLARALAAQGNLDEAQPLASRALTDAEALFEPQSASLFVPLFAAATVQVDDPARARILLDRALSLPNIVSQHPREYEDAAEYLSSLED